ncbi:MAG: amphi-Trp domain-containing protein [Pseudomonadota bacterium]
MATKELKIKTTAGLLETVKQMENLIASLKEGTICIRKNDEVIVLSPQEPVAFELEAEVKLEKNTLKEKLIIELKWRKEEKAVEERETFCISSEVPKTDAAE